MARENNNALPLIVGFVADIMFVSKIQIAAEAAGFEMRWLESAADLGKAADENEPVGELLHGRDGRLFQKIIAWQPALMVVDLTNKAVPWFEWLPALKSSPATRRIPIVAFAPHKDVSLIQSAKSRGADVVLARSRFFADMPALFKKYARIPDFDGLVASCAAPLPSLAREGITLFNQGEYYKCHDSLEEAWRQDDSMARNLYKGILQYGIALYQVERGNYRGAVKMLLRLRQWLDPLPAVCRTVHIAKLRQNIQIVSDAVQALGPDNLDAFDNSIVAPIEIVDE